MGPAVCVRYVRTAFTRVASHFCTEVTKRGFSDVIGEITFSRSLGYMERGSDDGALDAIRSAVGSGAWIGQVPWLYWLNDYMVPLLGNRLAIAARNGRLLNFAVNEVTGRKDRGSDRKDILSKLLAVQDEKPQEMDDNAVRNMAASNIFAGE